VLNFSLSDHADEIEGEVDDLEDEDLDENSYESCDDDNFEKEPKVNNFPCRLFL